MVDTWGSRDELVLRAIVEMADEGHAYMTRAEIAERTGLDEAAVRRSVAALAHEEPPFFAYHDLSGMGDLQNYDNFRDPTGHARRTVGAWPTPENLADRLVARMLQEADATEDEEQAGRLRRTASWLGNAGRDVLVNVVASAMTGG